MVLSIRSFNSHDIAWLSVATRSVLLSSAFGMVRNFDNFDLAHRRRQENVPSLSCTLACTVAMMIFSEVSQETISWIFPVFAFSGITALGNLTSFKFWILTILSAQVSRCDRSIGVSQSRPNEMIWWRSNFNFAV